MIETAIYYRLHGNSAIYTLVADRIFPDDAITDDTLPLISYHVEQVEDTSLTPRTTKWFELTVTCETASKAGGKTLSDAVVTALNGQGWTASGHIVSKCHLAQPAIPRAIAVGGNEDAFVWETETKFDLFGNA